jgi:arginine/lysine/ornithine decarboxylase
MPGGKRSPLLKDSNLPYEYDISEIEGFDDLHHSLGLIKELEERASKVYSSEETALLVNGSTAGLLSAILSCTSEGDYIIVGRCSHKSIYHGIFLNDLHAIYLYPDYDKELDINLGTDPEDVRKALDIVPNTKVKAVVITSPTYEGVVSDIKEIAEIVHQRNIPLIVDGAHGAHFGFHQGFPETANKLGADLVIHSVHKTLPSLTQTALIHKNGNLVDWERVRFYLQIFQSSSPSYILMSSIDYCISLLEDNERRSHLFENYEKQLLEARRRLKGLSKLELIETDNFDKSKILISTKKTTETGLSLYNILLEKYQLQMEMATGSIVVAMTSIVDTEKGFDRLVKALEDIDKHIEEREDQKKDLSQQSQSWEFPELYQVCTIARALTIGKLYNVDEETRYEELSFEESEDKVSGEFVYLYPPGIPLIVPGERISLEAIEMLLQYKRLGYKIKGTKVLNKIGVVGS